MARKILAALAALIISPIMVLNAQEKLSNGIEFDRYVHNFGDIMLDSGPVSCTFNLTNKGSKPVVIYNVTTTCGCTDVEWTREPIRAGAPERFATITASLLLFPCSRLPHLIEGSFMPKEP